MAKRTTEKIWQANTQFISLISLGSWKSLGQAKVRFLSAQKQPVGIETISLIEFCRFRTPSVQVFISPSVFTLK